ncbi:MAG: hypothetical protein KGD65_00725 [Candidatus Lokiarchaeota archaeon]|nr:hypothetical protein [Candidatus Lokiarchaeota archaeon]
MLIEEKKNEEKKIKEKCPKCGSTLECSDYIYRRRSSFSGYQCSNCGFSEFYDNN